MESEVLGPTQNSEKRGNREGAQNCRTRPIRLPTTKVEQKEEFRMEASLEQIADAVLSPLTSVD